jgi:hypothetical protein
MFVDCELVEREGITFVRDGDFLERLDWKWRSAQPGDVWIPKKKWEGTLIRVPSAMGFKEFRCDPLTIKQVHNADKAALCVDECERVRSVKLAALRKYWKPATVRCLLAEKEA